ncbi:MAG: bifunctional DNA-formamidopyrimidine glycosylase/DNA-(apurinic or apyrimidinic site) lyase [Patescibacteria group bacterium]
MPELPEVETIRGDLARKLVGLRIQSVEILNQKTVALAPAVFYKRLSSQSIDIVGRRAKLLFFKLKPSGEYLLVHLKMTGQLIYQDKHSHLAGGHSLSKEEGTKYPNRHTRVIFNFKNNGRLFFNDLRKFGYIKLASAGDLDDFIRRNYGPEPLHPDFSLVSLAGALKSKKTNIKAALLNQKNVSGLGNIYVDESLFLAKISPKRRADSLSAPELKKLYSAINKIIAQAIKDRGTTFNSYRDSEGRKGSFSHRLRVYGRHLSPCPTCGRPISKIKLAGRGTHYCSFCQV